MSSLLWLAALVVLEARVVQRQDAASEVALVPAALARAPGPRVAGRPAPRAPSPLMQTLKDRPPSISDQMRDVRKQMESDEDTKALMEALRGTNINDDDRAADGTTLRVVEMDRGAGDDVLPTTYDVPALAAYFQKRPGAVLTRVVQVMSASAGWLARTQLAAARGELTAGSAAEVEAVAELRGVLVSLGPFFIKLGQALSIRPDILSPKAMVQLQQLCDKVPPFDSEMAMATIREELGIADVSEVFETITPEPVAAASLGQVYKATLRRGGHEVAVKVQRPFVLETVSLDLYLARLLGQALRATPIAERLDVVALLDEFAANFYKELDYNLECENGIRVAEDMKNLTRVKIPGCFPDYTTRRVHVAEWVEGEKLSQSTADDVGELVNLGVITYLTQLLETGFFHADPHPGNMLRTEDGQLVILDFGLMTEITEDQRYGLIESIAHLINRDYALIGDDFQKLGFIPEGVDTKPIVPALARVFEAALAGGGAKSINFQDLAADLAEITFRFPFRIPPYFALIIRAISVLEGIALVGNPQFAIVDEAYPYLSRRLLTDESPRLRAALRYMVYGNSKTLDAERLIDLLQALEKFVAVRDKGDGTAFKVDGVRGGVDVGKAGDALGTRALTPAPTPEVVAAPEPSPLGASSTDAAARAALGFFFSSEGEVLRAFLLDEVVRAADAMNRDALGALTVTVATRDSRGPSSLLTALSPPVRPEDQEALDAIRRLLDFFLGSAEGSDGTHLTSLGLDADALRRARSVLPVLRENQQELRRFGLEIVGRLLELQTARTIGWLQESLEPDSEAA